MAQDNILRLHKSGLARLGSPRDDIDFVLAENNDNSLTLHIKGMSSQSAQDRIGKWLTQLVQAHVHEIGLRKP